MEEVEILQQQQLLEDRRETLKKNQKTKAEKIFELTELAQEIEINRVTILLRFILILSILADILGIIPVVGSIFGIFFTALFFVLYFINGLGRGTVKGSVRRNIRKKGSRWLIRVFFLSAEGVPVLGIAPLFTIMAVIEIVLSQKKVAKLVNKIKEIKNKLK
jgi:membrane protein insertase Oxa1/YidC/SpoIIIJ